MTNAFPPAAPHVSCIMPTRNRPRFVRRAIRCFLAQDYEALELLVLDDGDEPIRGLLPDDPRIRYFRGDRVQTIGAKRNALCERARGAVVMHWDDDDWYPPWRVSLQVEGLRSPGRLVSGTGTQYFVDPTARKAWCYQYGGPGPYVTGSTLGYRRSLWEKCPFPDTQTGEDLVFLQAVGHRQVMDLALASLCVSTIHGGNTVTKRPSVPAWAPVDFAVMDALLGQDRVDLDPPVESARRPVASCIMPTANRPGFVAVAIDLFQAQEGVDAELVVVDCGVESVEDLCRGQAKVRYVRGTTGAPIGAQRNVACAHATGDVIVHWDDDDWYGPGRLRRQLEPILEGRADVTGLDNLYTLDLAEGVFWTTSGDVHRRMFFGDVHGGTLAYRRSLLGEGVRYPEVSVSEDAALLRRLLGQGARLERVENEGTFVYVRHGRNAWSFESGSFVDPEGWRRIDPPSTMAMPVVERYRRALAGSVTRST